MKKNYFLLLLLITSFGFAQNLMTNGDLEAWDNTTTPTGYTLVQNIEQESTIKHGGTYSAKHTGGTKKLGQQVAGIVEGNSYEVSIWYKVDANTGDGTDARIWSNFRDASDTNITDTASEGALKGPDNGYFDNNNGDWTNYVATVIAPVGATSLNFELRTYGSAVVYWDDMSVTCTTCGSAPTMAIASPANNSVFAPSTTELDVTLAINNFVVANPGSGDGHIHYSLNGVAQPMVYTNDSPINVTGLVPGTHQLMFMLVDDNHDPLSPAVNATLDFEIASYTTVADLAALRADVTANGEGGYYELTSMPVITYARDTRNQKYIQDTSAGILIDDNDGVIATAMVMGDAISGLKGQASSYLGVLQFVPTVDASIDSSNNTITPETVTVADLATNHEDYESELIMLSSTTIDEGDGTATFAVNTNLNLDNGSLIFRTMFAEADYVVNSAVIPQGQIPFTALVAEYNGTPQVVARNSADFATNSTATFTNNNFTIYPNPSKGMVTVKADNLTSVAVYNTLGKMVLSTNQAIFNTASLQTGIYFVKVTANGATATQKLIVK